MITRIHEVKTLVKYISCDFNCKLNSTKYNLNQKQNNNTCQCKCKKYRACKKGYNFNPSAFIFENSKYLKSIADSLVVVCDKIMNAIDSVSTNITNTISTNMTNTISTNVARTILINSDDKTSEI